MVTFERRVSFLTLKQALLTDAIVSGTIGLPSLVGARWLSSILDLPTTLLAGSGAIALTYAMGLGWLATRTTVPSAAGRTVVTGNVLWATACVVLLLSGWIEPNSLGVTLILVHLAGALIFAEMQAMALRAGR